MNLQRSLLVTALICLLGQSAPAQQTSDQVLTRRQPATLEGQTTVISRFPDLRRESGSASGVDSSSSSRTTPKVSGSLVTICSSLAVVLGLFAGFVWLNRKFGSSGGNHGSIPKEVVQSLGSTPIDSRNRVTMVRCGNRILVLVQNAQGVQPITEITAPDEVRELTAACLGNSKQAFASTLHSIEQERTDEGFLGEPTSQRTPRARGKLFATA